MTKPDSLHHALRVIYDTIYPLLDAGDSVEIKLNSHVMSPEVILSKHDQKTKIVAVNPFWGVGLYEKLLGLVADNTDVTASDTLTEKPFQLRYKKGDEFVVQNPASMWLCDFNDMQVGDILRVYATDYSDSELPYSLEHIITGYSLWGKCKGYQKALEVGDIVEKKEQDARDAVEPAFKVGDNIEFVKQMPNRADILGHAQIVARIVSNEDAAKQLFIPKNKKNFRVNYYGKDNHYCGWNEYSLAELEEAASNGCIIKRLPDVEPTTLTNTCVVLKEITIDGKKYALTLIE